MLESSRRNVILYPGVMLPYKIFNVVMNTLPESSNWVRAWKSPNTDTFTLWEKNTVYESYQKSALQHPFLE